VIWRTGMPTPIQETNPQPAVDTELQPSRTVHSGRFAKRSLQSHGSRPDLTRARFARFLSYYRPHIPLLLADLGCAVVVSATTLFLPLCANHVTKRLVALGEGPSSLHEIMAMGGVMLGLLAAQALSTLFVDYQGHMMGAKMESALRKELFEHCQKLSFSFYDRQRIGQLMSRIANDALDLGELYHHGPEDLAIALLKFVGVIALLSYLDPPLTLLILAVTPFALAYVLHFSRRMNAAQRLTKERIGAINERVEDSLAGIRVVQSFASHDLENQRFEADNRAFLDSRRTGYRSEAFFSMGTSVFAQLLTVLVIVAGALRARLDIGCLVYQTLVTLIKTSDERHETHYEQQVQTARSAPEMWLTMAPHPGSVICEKSTLIVRLNS